jgi:hypothetical protein
LTFTHFGSVNRRKKVRLTQTTTPAGLIIRVEEAKIDASHLPESVFGLIIIYTSANIREYKRSNGTNHLSFVITKVPAPTPH